MKNKLLLFTVLILISSLTNAFIIKSNQSIQITKGADTFVFELKNVNGSTALLDKTYKSATYGYWYNPSDCLIKTERGCHLELVNVYSSENIGYAVLKDMDVDEEVTLSITLSDISIRLDEKDFVFKNVRELEPKMRDYTQSYLPCPSRNPDKEDIKLKIQELLSDVDRFNDTEIDKMILECKQEGSEIFTIKLKEKTSFIDECINKTKSNLSKNNITNYKEIDVIGECVIQEDFRERYSDKIDDQNNKLFFEDLFEKRIHSTVNNIKLEESTHKRTEEDDEEAYLQKLEQKRREDNPSTFDPNANHTLETFPVYADEPTENFLQRFFNYFKKTFNLEEWWDMLFQKKEERVSENK